MNGDVPLSPAFESGWLDALAGLAARLRARRPRLVDLYLERRLELVIRIAGGEVAAHEVRREGTAVRWADPARTVMAARNGISHTVVRELLDPSYDRLHVPPVRAAAVAELAPPAGWRPWVERLPSSVDRPLHLRLIVRRSAIVTGSGWHAIETPVLLHARTPGNGALLAAWDHPLRDRWLGRLLAPREPARWTPPSGTRLPVLFTAGSGGTLIHELVGHLAESDLVLAGGSPLAGLGGALIGPASLTIVDDPTRHDLPGAFDVDDEGVPARPETVVADGVLAGWLCDLHGAAALNARPGRGRRASWELPPVSRMSNLVVRPGDTAPADLERTVRDGLIVTRTTAASVDARSGLAVIAVEEGWELRDGRRRRRLAPCRLAAPALRTLATLDPAIGDDPHPDWRLGWCVKDGLPVPTGAETPTLLAHELQVL